MTSRTKDLYEKEGKVNTSIPRAGERILKVTKKSGNRGRDLLTIQQIHPSFPFLELATGRNNPKEKIGEH